MFTADLEYKAWPEDLWTGFHEGHERSVNVPISVSSSHNSSLTGPYILINKLEEAPHIIKELNLDLSCGNSLESKQLRKV